MKKAYFHLPGIFEFYDFYTRFIYLYSNDRGKFNDWAEIGSIYGAPRDSLWSGGRNKHAMDNTENAVANFMSVIGISCRITFTNCLLLPEHLSDTHCNITLKKFYNENNGIIVYSDILEQYIRDKYPNYKIISSTTKCIRDKEQVLEELEKDYETVVLDYNFNKDFDFLKQIQKKEKCELLVNAVCYPNCQNRHKHYELISAVALHRDDLTYDFHCPASHRLFYEAMQNPLFISVEEIEKTYLPMGYQHFKIEGRTTQIDDLIEALVYYMVKPEYQIEIRERLYYFDREIH